MHSQAQLLEQVRQAECRAGERLMRLGRVHAVKENALLNQLNVARRESTELQTKLDSAHARIFSMAAVAKNNTLVKSASKVADDQEATITALREGANNRRIELRIAQAEIKEMRAQCEAQNMDLEAYRDKYDAMELVNVQLRCLCDEHDHSSHQVANEMRISQLECEVASLLMTMSAVEQSVCALDIAADGLGKTNESWEEVRGLIRNLSASLDIDCDNCQHHEKPASEIT